MRNYKIFNYSNGEDIFKGETPKVAEVPSVDLREISFYKDWYYTNEKGYNFTQDIPSDFVAYHTNQTFEKM